MTPGQRIALTLEIFLLDLPVLWRTSSKETGRLISNWVGTGPRALLHIAQNNALAVGARITSRTLTKVLTAKDTKHGKRNQQRCPTELEGQTPAASSHALHRQGVSPALPVLPGMADAAKGPRTAALLTELVPTSRGAEISFAEGSQSGFSCELRPQYRRSLL